MAGGHWIVEGTLYIASPMDNYIYALDIESGKSEVLELHTKNKSGYISMVEKIIVYGCYHIGGRQY